MKVLLVEDNPVTRDELVERLRRAGHECRGVGDALAALDALRAARPQALVVDLVLPGMSGATLLSSPEASRVPLVVVITASDPAEWPGLPPAAVLRKPFEAAELLAILGPGRAA